MKLLSKQWTRFLSQVVNSILVETTSHSLTDCIVMALADHYSTKDIFGFDKQFEDAGYHRPEPSTEWREAA
jgi:predicted nucleic acid-binding protein